MGANYRKYDPEQTYLTVIDPEEIKKHNPLLLAVHDFVERHVSLASFSSKVDNEEGGAPAVHPRMMLKVLFYSYAKGIYRSREIEDHLRWDPSYIYLSGNQKVDHSTICGFILEYKGEIEEIFTKLVYVMAEMGYIGMDFVAVDGTKVRADVSDKFTGNVKDFREKRERIEKKVDEILGHTLSEDEDEKYRERRARKLKGLRRDKEKIDSFLSEVEKEERKGKGGDIQVALTDGDARMVKDKSQKYMGYNCQAGVDDKQDVIVASEVFNDASESVVLQPMVEELRRQLGGDLRATGMGFDAGYFSSGNVRYCAEQRLDVYMPEGRGEGGTRRRREKTIGSRNCKLEIDGLRRWLSCPGGQVLEGKEEKKGNGSSDVYRFYPKAELCTGCGVRERCYKGVKRGKRFSVSKEYFDTLPLREAMKEKLSSARGKQRMADRSCIIEHIFGEIKEAFKFRRFLHRGLEKVRTIWSIICIAYDLRKLARLGYT
jgi:transposase